MRKVLLINRLGIGDVVVTTPLAQMLKEYLNAQVGMLVSAKAVDVIRCHPYIDDAYGYDKHSTAKLIAAVRARGYQEAVIVDERLTSTLLARKAGCRLVNYGFEISVGKKGRLFIRRRRAYRAIADYGDYIRCFDSQFAVKEYAPVVGKVAAAQREKVAAWLKNNGFAAQKPVLIVPRGVASVKNWPVEYLAELNEYLYQKGHTPVYLGGQGDYDYIEAIRGAKINAAGVFTLREVAELARYAAFTVTPCTGTMHIIATVQTPILALYGSSNSKRWAPPHAVVLKAQLDCIPCESLTCKNSVYRACMQEIKLEEVIQCIEKHHWLDEVRD